jgi:putative transposase
VRPRRAHAYLAFQSNTVRSPDLIRFLRHLHRHIRGPIVLLWDGLHAHRGKEMTAFLHANQRWITAHRLPAYAPELNPVEGEWSWFKGTVAANFCPDGLPALQADLLRGRRRLQRSPSLLWGFLRKAGFFI